MCWTQRVEEYSGCTLSILNIVLITVLFSFSFSFSSTSSSIIHLFFRTPGSRRSYLKVEPVAPASRNKVVARQWLGTLDPVIGSATYHGDCVTRKREACACETNIGSSRCFQGHCIIVSGLPGPEHGIWLSSTYACHDACFDQHRFRSRYRSALLSLDPSSFS